MENILPVKKFKTERGSMSVVGLLLHEGRRARPSAMLTGKISSMQSHSGFRLQHCIGGERVPLVHLSSVVAANGECPRHWQNFFHQPWGGQRPRAILKQILGLGGPGGGRAQAETIDALRALLAEDRSCSRAQRPQAGHGDGSANR